MLVSKNSRRFISIIALSVASAGLLSGCARNISSNTYTAKHVGEASFTYQGTILSAREVQVKEHEYLGDNSTGAGVGALGGGLAGSQVGSGNGQIAGVVGGAVIGGIAGMFAEDALKEQTGIEYTVRLTNGALMTVVRGKDAVYPAGQRVFVICGSKTAGRV